MSVSETIGEAARAVIDELPGFRAMPAEMRDRVTDAFVPVSYSFGAVIVREGEQADAFYVLVSGTARVVKRAEQGQEVPLNLLRRGDSFGEIGLLGDSTRVATVRASGTVEALRLDREVFMTLTARDPAIKAAFERLAHFRSIQNFLRMYSEFDTLPVDGLARIAAALSPLDVEAGEVVVREGDPPGPMYVVEEGRLRIFAEGDGASGALEYLRKGDFFGELSVLHGEPRRASVEALTQCRLLALSPELFQELLGDYPAFRRRVEERAARREFRKIARVPIDFAEEILPAEVEAAEKVGADQVEPEARVPSGQREAPRRSRRGLPHVHQLDEMDCGAACVAMVTRYFGKTVAMPTIRDLVHTSTDGTSLLGIARGAQELGLDARTVRASKSKLDNLPLPAVVHWEGNHWVVLYEVGEQEVRVGDPAHRVQKVPREEFEENWSGYAALFTPTPEFERLPEGRPSYGWLKPILLPHRGTFVKAGILALVVAGLELLIPILTQKVVDDAIPKADKGLLLIIFAVLVGVFAASIGATILQRYILSRAAVRIDTQALDFLTSRLLFLPMSYFTTRRTGDIERRLSGASGVREFLVEGGVAALSAGTELTAVLVLMFVYSWELALVYLVLAPCYGLLMRFSAARLRPMLESLEENFGKYESQQIDAIRGIETVKSLAAEDGLRQTMLARFSQVADRIFRSEFMVMSYQGAIQLVSFLSLALFLVVGGLLVIEHRLSLGEFVAFNALVALGNAPVLVLLDLWDDLQHSRVLLDRLSDVVDHDPEQGESKAHLRTVTTVEGTVRLRGVGFRYGGPESPAILEGLDLDVRAGLTVAIVGRSGSGKTTLAKLLAGLLEPTEGTIEIDHVDLRTLDYRSVRRHTGFVLQENYLFDDTIARNIAFGEEPDLDRVLWAATIANAHEFVQRLPLGYDTRIGESGLRLSGGQAQRIAIARAVYHRPPVLLLDEASSALDVESEQAVKRNLDDLLADRTSFVIAHRLSTVRDADLIVVLERGRIVERGTHDELMELQGLYYYLVSQQLAV